MAGIYAWIDDSQVDAAGDVTKSACKLPHHVITADGTGGAANVRGCSAAIGVLNGARGGVDIPAADRDGVYSHVKNHMLDAGIAEEDIPTLRGTIQAAVEAGDEFAVDAATGDWEGVLVVEGVESGDGRIIENGVLTWREFPLPLMLMLENPVGGFGHDGARYVGDITEIERRPGPEPDTSLVWGRGSLQLGVVPEADTLLAILESRERFGVSVDLDEVEVEFVWPELDDGGDPEGIDLLFVEPELMRVTAARLMGATGTPFPAFQEAYITLLGTQEVAMSETEPMPAQAVVATGESGRLRAWVFTTFRWNGEAIVAAGAPAATRVPINPPLAWFDRPDFGGRHHPLEYLDDGRVFGHIATWRECHISIVGTCVTPPATRRSRSSARATCRRRKGSWSPQGRSSWTRCTPTAVGAPRTHSRSTRTPAARSPTSPSTPTTSALSSPALSGRACRRCSSVRSAVPTGCRRIGGRSAAISVTSSSVCSPSIAAGSRTGRPWSPRRRRPASGWNRAGLRSASTPLAVRPRWWVSGCCLVAPPALSRLAVVEEEVAALKAALRPLREERARSRFAKP